MEKNIHPKNEECCGAKPPLCDWRSTGAPFPMADTCSTPATCCDTPSDSTETAYDRPGYTLCSYVERFFETPAGWTPQIGTTLDHQDFWGTVSARLGIGRDRYKVAPGLYAVGDPGPDSPVLVTANYKLTFDALRKELRHLDTWILVLDTKGVNVWCAAGKGTFSTAEVVRRVKTAGLDRVVNHRKLILPQLAATGVAARAVKKGCGFEVVWGPIRVSDLKPFLNAGMKADPSMRRVTFPLKERLVLVPVELTNIGTPALWTAMVIFLLSGIGPGVYSIGDAWHRGLILLLSALLGVVGGAVITPALLPWIPGKPFAVKGVIPGLVMGAAAMIFFRHELGMFDAAAVILVAGAVSSYMAMYFTGSTPFTSPSGVEKEMRRAMPVQAGAVLIGAVLWVAAAFIGVHP